MRLLKEPVSEYFKTKSSLINLRIYKNNFNKNVNRNQKERNQKRPDQEVVRHVAETRLNHHGATRKRRI